jgi:uncharacterized membrane protein HdeD (DUF308 family)
MIALGKAHVIQTLTRNWWLLALCGVLNAVVSVIYLVMQDEHGPLTFHSWNRMIVLLGKLALTAGACTIAAGLWRSAKHKCWLLVLNGLALGALGLIGYAFVRFPISFLTIALLIIVMAVSMGGLELVIARDFRRSRHAADAWLSGLAAAISAGFAFVFLALGLRWIRIEPGAHRDLLWLGLYFGFTAICMLTLALRLPGLGVPRSGQREVAPPLLVTSH